MASLEQFDERTTEEIVRVVRFHLRRILSGQEALLQQCLRQPTRHLPSHFHAKITTTVTPADGDTPGIGKGKIYRYDTGDQVMKVLFDHPQVIKTVAPAAVHPDVWVPVHIDPWGDFWTETDSGIKIFTTPSGGIAARTAGGDLPSAVCDLQRVSVDPATGACSVTPSTDGEGTPITQTVYNQGREPVAGSIEIQAALIDGGWVTNWEDCGVAE